MFAQFLDVSFATNGEKYRQYLRDSDRDNDNGNFQIIHPIFSELTARQQHGASGFAAIVTDLQSSTSP
jgi:hypothetical protein